MNQNLDPKQNPDNVENPENNEPVVTNDETKTASVEPENDTEKPVADNVAPTSEHTAASASETATETTPDPAGATNGTAGDTAANTEKAGGMTGFVVGAIVLALLMIGGVWYFMSGTNVTDQPAVAGGDAGPTAASILGLDEGEPTDPIVEVNGEVLERAAYNRLRQQLAGQAQQQGMNLSATSTIEQINNQALETLINTELIRQAAVAAGGEVDSAAVDTRFNEIVEQVGGTDALASTLEEIGLTEASLREDVQQEILVQGYIDAELEGEDLTASEEEVTALYEEAGGAEAGLPPLEEVRGQVEQQIEASNRQEAVNAIVDALRESADVEVLI